MTPAERAKWLVGQVGEGYAERVLLGQLRETESKASLSAMVRRAVDFVGEGLTPLEARLAAWFEEFAEREAVRRELREPSDLEIAAMAWDAQWLVDMRRLMDESANVRDMLRNEFRWLAIETGLIDEEVMPT